METVPFLPTPDDEDELKRRLALAIPPPAAAVAPAVAPAAPAATPALKPGIAPPDATGALPAVAAPSIGQQRLSGDQDELARLKSTGSGLDQFSQKHHVLGGILRGAEILGTSLFPTVAAQIPGTDIHHNVLMNQQQGRINADQAGLYKQAQLEQEQAQTNNLNAQPEIKAAKSALDQDKLEAQLHSHGFKHDEAGNIVPLGYEEMSQEQQAVHDLKSAQQELTDANAAIAKAKKENMPMALKLAQQRALTAQENASTAAGRLGLGRETFERDTYGTVGGQAIPGAPTDENGNAVGLKVASSNATSSDRLKRSDLANNVIENTGAIRKLITENPNLFGKVAGRFTSAQQMIGSDDPAIAELGVRVHNAALASNGAHGLRSQEAIAATEREILNHFRNSPQATISALDALDDSVGTFINAAKQGKRPQNSTGAKGGSPQATHRFNPQTGQIEAIQ